MIHALPFLIILTLAAPAAGSVPRHEAIPPSVRPLDPLPVTEVMDMLRAAETYGWPSELLSP